MSGLFTSEEYPFLGASPGRLVGNDRLIGVKCLVSVTGTLKESDSDQVKCYNNTKWIQFCIIVCPSIFTIWL